MARSSELLLDGPVCFGLALLELLAPAEVDEDIEEAEEEDEDGGDPPDDFVAVAAAEEVEHGGGHAA
jgi:hypothetical protein